MWHKAAAAAASLKQRPLAIALLLLVWWLACWSATGIVFDDEAQRTFDAEHLRTEQLLSESMAGYERIIATRRGMIRVLARDQTYRNALSRHSPLSAATTADDAEEDERRRRWNADPRLAALSRELATAARDFGMRSIWLMDANGDCIAASNATEPSDQVGTRYADRDYFQAALAGRSAYQITNGRRHMGASISFSAPVTDQAGRVIGVLAGGNALSTFTSWRDQASAFFTDRHGVVILAKDPAMILNALPNAPAQSFDAATLQKRYKTSTIPTLRLPTQRDAQFPELLHFSDGTAPVMFGSHPSTDREFFMHVLQPLPQLADIGRRRALYAGALGVVGSLLALLASAALLYARQRRAAALALAEREQQVAQARNFLDQIVNAIADPLFVKDHAHRWVLVNQAFCKIHGQPREHFIGKVAHDVFPERVAQRTSEADERVLTAGIESIAEEKLTDSHGVTHIVITKKAPYTDAAGQRFIVGIISDISGRKEVERQLRARERESRSLAENMPDNVARWDTNGCYLYINPVHERLLGMSLNDVIGTAIADKYTVVKAAIAQVVTTGQASTLLFQPDVVHGEPLIHQIRLAPEFDDAGQVVSVLGIGRDITDIHRMQTNLAAREREFRSLAESAPDAIVRYDREVRMLYLNDRWLRHLALDTANEALGKRPGEVWPDGRFAELEQAAQRAVESGNQEEVELVEPTGTGTFRHHQIVVVPERDASGQIIGSIAFGRDITAIREAERKLAHFIDNLPGLAYTYCLSPQGHGYFPYISSAIERIFGLKAEDVKDNMTALHALWHPDDQVRMAAAAAESKQTMRPLQIESRVCRPGQPERWFDVRSMPVQQPDGSILRYGLMLDITERKRIEAKLVDALEFSNGIINAIPDLLFECDREGRYLNVWTQKQNQDMLAAQKEGLLGKTIRELLPPEASELAMAAIGEADEKGFAYGKTISMILPNGQTRWFEHSLSKKTGHTPEQDTFLVISRDVSDTVLAQRHLDEARTRLHSALQAMPDMV